MTVTPAYGRDYKSAKAATAAWNEGADFIVADMMNPYCGQPINKEGAKGAGLTTVNIRFNSCKGITVAKIA